MAAAATSVLLNLETEYCAPVQCITPYHRVTIKAAKVSFACNSMDFKVLFFLQWARVLTSTMFLSMVLYCILSGTVHQLNQVLSLS